MSDATTTLPAVRIGADGRRRVDARAVLRLAAPLMVTNAIQAALNLTDTWFIGRISTEAMAAMGAVHFLAIVFLLALGGVGLAVQTFVAQAYGARLGRRAAMSTWQGLWATLLMSPLFVAVAFAGAPLLAPFGIDGAVVEQAVAWWRPRLLGGPLAVALWGLSGFFNGLGRARVTLFVMLFVAIANAALNALFIFVLDWGIAGSAWATTASLAIGCAISAALFLSPAMQHPFRTRLMWRFRARHLRRLLSVGIPTGMFPAVDLVAISLFQLMQVKLGVVQGAATQIVMMLTSIAYLPAIGIGIAGTTLVGQSIGAGDRDWAQRVGNITITLAAVYMGLVGLGIALAGPWLVPMFTDMSQSGAEDVVKLGVKIIWIAGAYQVFDALNLTAAFCLRGAGDVKVPTFYLVGLAWVGFVPLAHMFSFAPGEGWVNFLPHFGWGTIGGWWASLAYIFLLGVMMLSRWHSAAWRRIEIYR